MPTTLARKARRAGLQRFVAPDGHLWPAEYIPVDEWVVLLREEQPMAPPRTVLGQPVKPVPCQPAELIRSSMKPVKPVVLGPRRGPRVTTPYVLRMSSGRIGYRQSHSDGERLMWRNEELKRWRGQDRRDLRDTVTVLATGLHTSPNAPAPIDPMA